MGEKGYGYDDGGKSKRETSGSRKTGGSNAVGAVTVQILKRAPQMRKETV